jgi:MinD-like ATPase involved in chromosome partitioning or flagellar assembly
MTVRVATVLSAHEWEPTLVAHAHETAAVRIVLRAFQPSDIESRAAEIDVVVAGGEVAWVTERQVGIWKRLGLGVVGVFPTGDRPSQDVFERGGADETVPDSTDALPLIQAIRFVAPRTRVEHVEPLGDLTVVVGARGAPGCTEVALAYAMTRSDHHDVVLIDLDLHAPAIAVRLGVPPRPDIADAADSVRSEGVLDRTALRRYHGISVITGSHRPGQPGISPTLVRGLIDALRADHEEVIADMGVVESGNEIVAGADRAIIVVEGSALGIVRTAQLTSRWIGPTPYLVVNRVRNADTTGVVDAVRTWTGLEPIAVIPDHRRVHAASRSAQPPDRRLTRALVGVDAS